MTTQPSYLTDQFQTLTLSTGLADFKEVIEAINAWQINAKGIDFRSIFPITHLFCQRKEQYVDLIVREIDDKGYLPFLSGYSAAPYLPVLDADIRLTFLCASCNDIYASRMKSTIATWYRDVEQAFSDQDVRQSFLAIPAIEEMLKPITLSVKTETLSAHFTCEIQTDMVGQQLIKPEWDSMWRCREMIRSLSLYTNYGDSHWIHRARLIIDTIEEKAELTPDEAIERLKAVFGATPWRAVEQLEGLGPEANVNAFLFRLLSGTNVDLSLRALRGVQPSLYF